LPVSIAWQLDLELEEDDEIYAQQRYRYVVATRPLLAPVQGIRQIGARVMSGEFGNKRGHFVARQLGGMLRATPRNTGAAGGGVKSEPRGTFLELRDTVPTLSELDLDKKISALAQKLVDLWLACYTQEEIGQMVGVHKDTVSGICRNLAELPESDKPAAEHMASARGAEL